MTEHPLTFQDIAKISQQRLITTELCEDMRAAADEQLEQVIKWLDKNVAHYHYRHYYDTGEYPRPNRRWDKLTEHLKEAMRPAQEEDS